MATLPRPMAILTLVGTIIGVGMFALPYLFWQSGFLVGLGLLIVLTVVMVAVHRAYAEVVLSQSEIHRLPGYVGILLGKRAKRLAYVSEFIGLAGTLLAYLVLGTFFLSTVLSIVAPALPSAVGFIIFYGLGVFAVLHGLRFSDFFGAALTVALLVFIAVFVMLLLPTVSFSFLQHAHGEALFSPYGAILFSLAGASVIPDLAELLGRKKKELLRVVTIGTVIPAIVYAFFALVVVGVSGASISPDGLSGVASAYGVFILFLGSVIGFFATITSFIPMTSSFARMLELDGGMPRWGALGFALTLPVVLFAMGLYDFILIIGVVGAVGVGCSGALIFLSRRALHRQGQRPFIFLLLAALFFAGIVIELLRYL